MCNKLGYLLHAESNDHTKGSLEAVVGDILTRFT